MVRRGHGTVWLSRRQNRAWRGARSKEGSTLRPGHPLLAEAASSSSTTTGANCLCDDIVDRGPETGTDLPKAIQQKTGPEPRPSNFHRLPLTTPDSLDLQTRPQSAMGYGQRQGHLTV